ncbi:sensor histidine kinase [Lacihabitans sp. LS3-19]|uniref:sensor histidine kinase n=1 Tax=Lacihabitans sp. LS3-19 TaxID=2487335 RepID=UPI0020CB7888|nr:histidine kinase [Lacihabitans sp. LS3-19]MCP9770038.1 sensor histidine kinase [Lacihabitans sp. LS3-19]
MNFKQSYWLFQIGGWTFFFLSDFINYFLFWNFNYAELESLFFNLIINILVSISLTHFFRVIFKKYSWIKLSIPQLIWQSAVGIFVITFLLTAINITLDETIIDTSKANWILRDIAYVINLSKPVLIWVLVYIFYSYTNERRIDAIERIKLQTSIEASEAKILRAQINPHFMFNALNSIRALILEDPSKAQKGITQLSNILRSSLVADRKTTISLKEELKTIEDYLELEKVRYEERLQIMWDVDQDTLNIQVPPMMLQTLVENAIKHGVQKATRWGFVEVNTSKIDNNLVIKIRNTGVLKKTENNQEDGGFGLVNTEKRLKLLYGSKADFQISQEDSQIVCAVINIPLSV